MDMIIVPNRSSVVPHAGDGCGCSSRLPVEVIPNDLECEIAYHSIAGRTRSMCSGIIAAATVEHSETRSWQGAAGRR